MNGADSLTFAILAWPLICLALYAIRALYRTARTHTRRTR